MRILNHRPFPLLLDILGPHHQRPHRTRLLLPLRHHNHHLTLLQLATPPPILDALLHLLPLDQLPILGQPPTLARQPGRHERRAREHEADGAAVDADRREGLREAVHEAQVRHNVGRVLLVEERDGVEHVEGVAVGQLHRGERGLFRHDLVDVRGEEREGLEERAAQRALDGGFEFLFGRGGEACEAR